MRRGHHRLARRVDQLKQRDDTSLVLAMQCTGWLICKNELCVVCKGARDDDSLP
jgi:hypothetical protein